MPNSTNPGERAYEAYCAHQGNKSHSGAPLPAWSAVAPPNQAAWESFAAAARAGETPDHAYSDHYLGWTRGLTIAGAAAPAFAYFKAQRRDIYEAWGAAWRAALVD